MVWSDADACVFSIGQLPGSVDESNMAGPGFVHPFIRSFVRPLAFELLCMFTSRKKQINLVKSNKQLTDCAC